ncbi:MAG: biopolymer transporter ExbD, partial [Proteobacteria bacterium]|nr:biopolymer transporter ExbD [Pseudomonadota bacterium]
MTPMIDVVFQLMIFFMYTAQFAQVTRTAIDLPDEAGEEQVAHAVAENLGMRLLTWHIKSTTKAQDGLYQYDVVQR